MLTDDFSDRKSATLSAIKKNKNATKFVESLLSEVFSIWDLDDPKTQFENPALLNALGYENRDHPILFPIHPKDLIVLNKAPEEVARNVGDEFELDLRFKHLDQRNIVFRCSGSRIAERDIMLSFVPIYEKSDTYDCLKVTNNRYHSLLTAVGDFYYVLDPNFNVISYLHDPEKIQYVFSEFEITGKNVTELGFPPELTKKVISTLKKAVSTRNRVRTTFAVPDEEGQRWLCLNVGLVIDDTDEIIELACSIHDVTKEKKFEMEVSRISLLRQTLIDHIPGWVICKDYDGHYLFVNKSFADYVGKPVEELIGTTDFDYEPNPELALNYKIGDQQVIDSRVPSFSRVKDVVLANGSTRSLEVTKIPIDVLGLEKGAVIVIINDVTENENAQSELNRTKLMLEESNHVAKIGSWELNLCDKTLAWSSITKSIHEVDENFVPNLDEAIQFYPRGEFRDQISILVTKCIEFGETYDTELKIITAKGNERWVRTVGSPRIHDGKCVAIFGTFQDIDDRKREEERLKLLESVVTNTKEVVAILSIRESVNSIPTEPKITFINQAFSEITGYSLMDFSESYFSLFFGPNSDHRQLQEIFVKMTRHEVCEGELLYYKKNREESWMSFAMVPVADSRGNYTHWVVVARDINERRNAEIELRNAKARLSTKTEIISAIAQTAETLIFSNQLLDSLEKSFELIGRSAKVDRVYYFESDPVTNLLSQKVEWTAEPFESTRSDERFQEFPSSLFSEEFEPLLQNRVVQFFTSEIVDSDFRKILESHSVKAFLSFPIFVNNRFFGLMGFDDCSNERRWSDTEIEMFQALVRNVSNAIERMEAEKLIKASEMNFRQITETLEAVFWLYDSIKNKYIYMSPACKQVYGVSPDYFYSGKKYIEDFVIDGITNDFFDTWQQSKSDDTFSVEYRIRRMDSEIRWIKETGFAIRDENGECLRISGFSTDITDEVQKREQLRHLLNVTGSLNKRLLNFAHIVSHNIRSHSSNLSMLVDFINKSKNQTEQLEYVQMLGESTKKLSETIDNLNEIVRIQNSFSDERTRVNLREELEKTTSVLSSSILETKTVITNSIPDELFVSVIPSYLESIFLNLLTNSIKYRSIDRALTIEVSTQLSPDFIIVKFSDNGIGIDLDMHRHKIFGMYKTFHGNEDARGIGLFMTKSQIEVMGGTIEVESQINVGTTFTVSFKRNG